MGYNILQSISDLAIFSRSQPLTVDCQTCGERSRTLRPPNRWIRRLSGGAPRLRSCHPV